MLKLAWKNIVSNPLNLIIGIILFALGIGLMTYLLLLNRQVQEKFESNLADIDLVLGAKGSPLQLILCNMYHIDNPTGNITIEDAKPFLNPRHPLIKKAVPLSLGDNYRTFRIVGTTHEICSLYNGSLDSGKMYEHDLEVTIGKQVADVTGLKLGDQFVSSHGFMDDDDLAHEHASFKVVGILKPTGSVLDQLILTTTSSIWAVHQHEEDTHDHDAHDHDSHDHDSHDHNAHDHDSHDHDAHDHDTHDHDAHEHDAHNHDHNVHTHEIGGAAAHSHNHTNEDLLNHPDEQITSILIQYKSKTNFQALSMPRNINENTNLQAASPAYEINKLRDMIGIGTNGIKVIAWLIALVSALSIFISLFKSMKERKYELALMRVMGGSRNTIFTLVILEGLILALIGWVIGTILAHIGIEITGRYLMEDFRYSFSGWRFITEEWLLLGISLLIGFIAAFIPASQASSSDINRTLIQ